MRFALKVLLTLVLYVAGINAGHAEKRIALVIGNAAYKDSPLTNPKNDAQLMTETLEKVGFEVTTLIDGDFRAMKLAMVRFGRKLRASDTVGLFYYAGHGVQSRGENYLIPVDAEIIDESEIDVFAINVNDYLRTMERASSRINIVVLDACRNNPFAGSFRSQLRGLARVDAPRGTYIAYATAPGKVALDGTGQNSPYTKALSKAIATPGLTIEETFKEARRSVLASTGERQTPWETSSITGRFFFKKAPSKPQINREDLTWSLVKDSTNPSLIQTYLTGYPAGKYAREAKAAIARLNEELEAHRRQEEAERKAKEQKTAKVEADRLAVIVAAAKEEADRKARLEAAAKVEADRLAKLEAERKARQAAEAERRRKRAQELADWRAVRTSRDPGMLQAYISKYPSGTFADLASARLKALKSQRLAALQPPANEATTGQDNQQESFDERELALRIQRQLQRLGCSPGRPDGSWGSRSKRALEAFTRHSKVRLTSLEPTVETLQSLKQQEERVCPLICGNRERKKNGRCVLKTCPRGKSLNASGRCVTNKKAAPKKKTTKTRASTKRRAQRKKTAAPKRPVRQKRKGFCTQRLPGESNC